MERPCVYARAVTGSIYPHAALTQFGQDLHEHRFEFFICGPRDLGRPARFLASRPREFRGPTGVFSSTAYLFGRFTQLFPVLS